MRKVIVSMNVTLDGFTSGPNGELDWHFQFWNEEMAIEVAEQLSRTDTILLGRITYEAMAGYWPAQMANRSFAREDIPFADMMNSHQKIVFSRTVKNLRWNNSITAQKNIADEIAELKRRPGKDMMVYGSASIVSALIQLRLVDEYQIWEHPVILGSGRRLFNDAHHNLLLKLSDKKIFDTGVILFFYHPCMSL